MRNPADPIACRTLWQAVLIQAFTDAGIDKPVLKSDEMQAQAQARSWLSSRSQDLANVCYLAGTDPSTVMQAWKKRKSELKYV